MKKLLLLLFMFAGFNVFGQENFDGVTAPALPSGWTQFETGTGTGQSWLTTNSPTFIYGTTGNSALINRENVAAGQAIDWLVTNQIAVPTNGQIRFQTKTIQTGVQGSLFDIKISTVSQTNPADFTNLISWDEASLTATANVFEEKIIDIPATYPPGTLIYIAFVMTNDNGDRWVIDNVNVVQKCLTPIGPLLTSGETTTSALLSWGNPGGVTLWDIQVCPFADTFGGGTTINYNNVVTPPMPFNATGLLPNTLYKFQVRSVCNGVLGPYTSDWFGPKSFQTASLGDTCTGPIVVGALPYQVSDNTANYMDTNDVAQPLTCSGTATNYMQGNDVFYSFTPATTGNYIFNLAPTNAGSSIHVYSQCPVAGMPAASCLGGVANTGSGPRNIVLNGLVGGTTYYVIISSSSLNQTVGYTLTIQQAFCNQPTGLAATITSATTADLSWVVDAGITSWEVSYAPEPYGLPTGAGTTTTMPYQAINLIPGVVYQYYVRANCNDGNFSVWSGPFTFSTPQIATALNFTDGFETLTGWTLANGSQSNKWAVGTGTNNGGTHALYITDTNGSTNTYNVTATSVVHAYKDFVIPAGATQLDLTFDWRSLGEAADYIRVWTVPTTFNPVVGTQITALANSRIKVGNDLTSIPTFTTQNYTLNATPYAGSTMRLVFEWRNNNAAGNQPPAAIDNIKLDLITCPKPGNLVISNILYNSAQVEWANGGSESQWEVLVLPAGSPAPTAGSVGTITSGNPFSITGLTSVTCYDVYVRARCSATEFSFWSVKGNFCTTPNYCAGDHFYDTGGATGNYSNSENITSIICPNNAGDVVTVVFNDFNLATGDNLVIRDGNLPTSPIVGTYSGVNLPPSFTATSASGCITFVFTSTASVNNAGWDATIYCTPPITCFKPVALTANPIGSTTATLSWTESGTATQWEILVVPFGSNAPILGQSGIPVNGPLSSYIVTGLSPSTTYTFYVRAICSSTSASFWSDGFTFSTTPINDLCLNATTAIVNDDLICSQINPGTLFGSTNTAGVPAGCSPTANDVWYRFIATRTTHTMSLLNVLPAGADIDFALYTGTSCTALTQVQCFTAVQNVVNNLTIGQTYYIRVFSGTNQLSDFDLCIGGVPCPESVSLCNTPITYPNTTNVINLGSYACLGSAPNASFFFLEAAQNGTLAYTISQTSGDVDYALWGPFPNRNFGCGLIPMEEASPATTPITAYPNDPVQCSYSTAAVENFSVNVLQGQVYILMVTNFVNQPGSITISPNPTNTAQSFCYPYNTFSYPTITYCNSSPNQTPTLLAGAVAGTYSAVRVEDGSTTAMVINPTTGEINFVASQPGTYTVTNTLIPTLPAPASNAPIICTRTVIITPTPNATFAYSSATYCKSNTTSQTIAITGNTGDGTSFSSTPTGLESALDPVTGSIIPILGNVGVYTVTLTVPAQGGCPQYTTTTQVEIIAAPIIPAQVDVVACNSYILQSLTVGNYYTGTGGTGTLLNAGDVISTNQTIYVYATNGQCFSEDPFNVIIVTIPTPTFDYLTQPTCAVQTGSINITAPVAVGGTVPTNLFISEVTDANTGSLTYVELYNGTGAPINLSGYKLRTFNNGSGTVSTGCDNALSGTIANNSTFIIKLSADANIPGVTPNLTFTGCGAVNDNDNIRLTTSANVLVDIWGLTTNTSFTPSGQPGYTYRRLANSSPLPNTTWTPGQWNAIDPENYSDLGNYTLNSSNYEYSVDNGPFQTSTTFTGLTPGSHSFVVHDLINNCYSAPIPFTINAVPYTTAVTDFSYTTPICITNTTNPSPVLAAGFTSGGTFSYTGTGLDLNSTNGTINLATSTGGLYTITYTYPEDLANCIHGGTFSFPIEITTSVTPTFAQIPNICQNAVAPTLPSASTNTPPISGTWNAAINTSAVGTTTYTFTPNPGQCGVITTMDITVVPIVVPTFTAIANICQNEDAPLLLQTSNNSITGTWNPSVINTAITGASTYTFTPNAGQCSQPVSISVTIDPSVLPTFTQIEPLCIGDANVTLPTVSNNSIEGSWSPAVVNTSVDGTLVYTFTPDDSECASTTTMLVQVEFCQIQKGISPNGDNMNDYLELKAKKVAIFNRFGREVYTKTDYNNDWHGQFMGGGDMPDGTYYYVIELISGDKKTGWIYINREQK